jgi:WhiB family redox-sensing transcriptional regulator
MSVVAIPTSESRPEHYDEIILWPRRSRSHNSNWELDSLLRLHNRTWVRKARCLGLDPDMFFPDGGGLGSIQEREVKAVCKSCPVQLECLVWAIKAGEADGIYGGTSDKDRRRLRRKYPDGVTRELMVQFFGINVEQTDREQIRSRVQPVSAAGRHR